MSKLINGRELELNEIWSWSLLYLVRILKINLNCILLTIQMILTAQLQNHIEQYTVNLFRIRFHNLIGLNK